MKQKDEPGNELGETTSRPWTASTAEEWRNSHRSARELRQQSTRSEEILWDALRAKRFRGLKFRRQHPLGRFVVDFYCECARLAIEIDGTIHDERQGHDEARQALLESSGIRFVRVRAELVEHDLTLALQAITRILDESC